VKTSPHREPTPPYQDVWDWDIVLVHGEVKIMGFTTECLWRGDPHPGCDCKDSLKISSSVLDRFGKPLEDSAFSDEPVTGAARPLLACGPGSELRVKSGKTYRLCGERKQHDGGFGRGSIWLVYAEADAKDAVPPRWWERVKGWLTPPEALT
jgi:hypothetical protein